MRVPSLRFPRFEREDLERLAREARRGFDELGRIEVLDGVLLADVALTTTPANVEHTLGRPWRGWIVTRKSANVDVWEATQADTARFVTLDASAAVTVSLWVF